MPRQTKKAIEHPAWLAVGNAVVIAETWHDYERFRMAWVLRHTPGAVVVTEGPLQSPSAFRPTDGVYRHSEQSVSRTLYALDEPEVRPWVWRQDVDAARDDLAAACCDITAEYTEPDLDRLEAVVVRLRSLAQTKPAIPKESPRG